MRTSCSQVSGSRALKTTLRHALRLGNYLNGTSARGGAYGFKLADLGKLVQVKSGDSKTTLLHYLAKSLCAENSGTIEALKVELNALPEAKEIPLADKKAELAKLILSVGLARGQHEHGKRAGDDAMTPLLAEFCDNASKQLEELKTDADAADAALKNLAGYLAEKSTSTAQDLFRPLADFVKAIEKAHQDNVKQAEAERRKEIAAASAGSTVKPWAKGASKGGAPLGAPPMPGFGLGADKSMMSEMMLKMAQRAEKAQDASGQDAADVVKAQRQMLVGATAKVQRDGSSVGSALADSLAGGALFAQRRAQAMQSNS